MNDRGPSWAQRIIRDALAWLLPEDDWSGEFLSSFDEELEARSTALRGLRLTLWYLGQALSPATVSFVWAARSRRRRVESMSGRGPGALLGLEMDLRQGWRSVVRDPLVSAMIVLTLAAGLGSVAAMYSLSDRLFLRGALHVTAPQEVVGAYLAFNDAGGQRTSPWIPYLTARAIQEQSTVFSESSLYRLPADLADFGERVRPVDIGEVDGKYFGVLGVLPEVGRLFGDDEANVTVLSYRVAVREFASPSAALGRTVRIGMDVYSVVGVTPEGFAGPNLDRIDVWIPIEQDLAGNRNWWLVARVPSDRSIDVAAEEAQAIHERQDPGRSFRWANDGAIGLAGHQADLSGERSVETSIAGLLLSVVGLALLIAWANALNLLLARAIRRERDTTVRLALGIGRWRLARMLLVESLLVSVVGGLLSLPVAYGEALLVRRVLLPDVAWPSAVLDLRVLGFTLLGVLVSGMILGVLPVRHAGQSELSRGTSGAGRGASRAQRRVQTGLATAQITLSAVLLLCAGLFVKSFWTMRVTDLGMDADRVRVVTLRSLDYDFGGGAEEEDDLYFRSMTRLRDRGNGGSYALAVGLPFFTNFGKSIHVEGVDSIPQLPGGGPFVSAVSGGYFETIGTRILRGEGISDEDVSSGAAVTVIGEATARALWPNTEAVGRCIRVGAATDPCLRVSGVAEDVHRQGYREPPSLQLYIPIGVEAGFSGPALLYRPPPGTGISDSQLADEIARFDPGIDYVEVRRLDSLLDPEIRPWRLGAVMLTMVAALAIVMSVAGVFGVLTYIVTQRRREIGIRIALGASTNSIRRLVLQLGAGAGAIGVALGFSGALASSRWLGPLLFETSVADPLVMLVVGSGLFAVALVACVLPAAQAAGVDPAQSLQMDG